MPMLAFELDPRLARDTLPVARLALCEMRLMDDSRWPWLVLVPQRPGVTEIHALTPLDQVLLAFEQSQAAETLRRITGAEKINIAAIGNIVPMLHLHLVARSAGDEGWPQPVWGRDGRAPYAADAAARLADALRQGMLAA